ncbi:hypothetical protein IM792_20030 [Mucilaginibacter sp. JRF]|uniref:hypothetical protein n=1 Tax=Mucilaginibacter sp. JRF TaxID=2780088 RepID=UPI00187F3C4B|nr:hypothetical protein [Mucilaginibacter sp. JRF]MBE9586749.1 hypothetical protein [Mucilaginibacter sp. JRF]
MKQLIILLITMPLLLLNLDCIAQKRNREREARNKIEQLPEVKDFLRKTPKEYRPIVEPDGGPTKGDNYYRYSLMTVDDGWIRTSMTFYVEARTMQIYFWDYNGYDRELVTLKEWRYWRTKPVWEQLHHFVNGKMVPVD